MHKSAQTSDRSVKEDIELASLTEIQQIFDQVEVKTYTRNDGPESSRVGFIAQDLAEAISIDSKLDNLVNPFRGDKPPLLGVDYNRLVCILWGVCKNLQTRIDALEAHTT